VLWGTGLIVFGMLSLLAVITGWSVFQLALLPTLAALFLVGGISTRATRLMIPAGILSGLSVGTVLATLLEGKRTSDAIGGIVVLCLGLSVALILALQAVFATFTHWWPIIPATMLVVIGTTLARRFSWAGRHRRCCWFWSISGLWRCLQSASGCSCGHYSGGVRNIDGTMAQHVGRKLTRLPWLCGPGRPLPPSYMTPNVTGAVTARTKTMQVARLAGLG
jgi:hypothetical protein